MINIKLVSSKSTKSRSRTTQTKAALTDTKSENRKNNMPTTHLTRRNSVKPKGRGGVVALIVILAVIIAAGALVAYAGFAASSDRIYPNISAYGIKLGGMTLEEATKALKNSEYNEYNGKKVTVSFPTGLVLEIDAESVGLCGSTTTAAEQIYNYGRNGSFFVKAFNYLSCLILPKELDAENFVYIDEDYIRDCVYEAALTVDTKQLENSLTYDDDKVTVIKGSNGVTVDKEEVFRRIYDAFLHKDFTPIHYSPDTGIPSELDINAIKKVVYKEPKNAEFDEKFNVKGGDKGITFDEADAKKRFDEAAVGDKVVIPLIYIDPEITRESLETLIFRDIIAEKTTELTSNETRSTNIELAAKEIDGLIMYPGDVFSFNDVVGERTTERGFGKATAYAGGETVQEVGGGICQVSSTIYYACLLADLEIVYRTCHMYPADYLPYGMDATVSWGGPDYKFKNSTEYPIKIVTWREGYYLHVELYGTKTDDTYVKMEYEILNWISPKDTYKPDPSVPSGEKRQDTWGFQGLNVETYRCKYNADGSLISRTYEDYSDYSAKDNVFMVNPDDLYNYVSPPPDWTPSPTPTPSEEPPEQTDSANETGSETASPEIPDESGELDEPDEPENPDPTDDVPEQSANEDSTGENA